MLPDPGNSFNLEDPNTFVQKMEQSTSGSVNFLLHVITNTSTEHGKHNLPFGGRFVHGILTDNQAAELTQRSQQMIEKQS